MQIQSLAHGAPKAQTAGRVCQNKVSLYSFSAFTLFPEILATGHCQKHWAEEGFLQPLLWEWVVTHKVKKKKEIGTESSSICDC